MPTAPRGRGTLRFAMLITCRTCSSSYHIPREILGDDGAQLRCAGCGDIWAVTAPRAASDHFAPGPEAVAADRAQIPAEDAPEASPTRRFRRLNVPMLIGVAALAAMATIGERRAIVRNHPGSARVFAALGLPVNSSQMALENVAANLGSLDERNVLMIEGAVVNLRDQAADAPDIRIAIRGEDARELYVWTVRPPRARLGANEQTQFRARLATPPAGARDVLVKFASAGDKDPSAEAGL